MTRKKQIEKAAKLYAVDMAGEEMLPDLFDSVAFTKGALWADKHPSAELCKLIVNTADNLMKTPCIEDAFPTEQSYYDAVADEVAKKLNPNENL